MTILYEHINWSLRGLLGAVAEGKITPTQSGGSESDIISQARRNALTAVVVTDGRIAWPVEAKEELAALRSNIRSQNRKGSGLTGPEFGLSQHRRLENLAAAFGRE